MSATRICSHATCLREAVATLTYAYADRAAVLGPLAAQAEPHTYDLCAEHAERLTVPRGWEVIRLAGNFEPAPPSEDDLLALADAVREATRRPYQRPVPADRTVISGSGFPAGGSQPGPEGPRKAGSHLRLVAPVPEDEPED